ncbi:MAG: ATP-binding cassette domain-containing protein, partial [Haloferacaceae archaeon]
MGESGTTGRETVAGTGDRSDPSGAEARSVGDQPDAGRDPALVVDGVSKQFGGGDDAVLAVDGVSFAIDRGSVVGLLGPNGAGKTTLIKCVLGIVIPDSGSVRVLGSE